MKIILFKLEAKQIEYHSIYLHTLQETNATQNIHRIQLLLTKTRIG